MAISYEVVLSANQSAIWVAIRQVSSIDTRWSPFGFAQAFEEQLCFPCTSQVEIHALSHVALTALARVRKAAIMLR